MQKKCCAYSFTLPRSSYLKVGSDINPREFYQVSQSLLVLLFSTGMHYPLTSPPPQSSPLFAEDENLDTHRPDSLAS